MTLIFAHRGYSALFPENTMKAFKEAKNVNADGLELDVQMTKDKELVVIHDEKVDRTTGGGGFVKDFTAKQIRKLDAGVNTKTLVKREPIPFLKEVFEWMSEHSLFCNIELKNGWIPYHGMEEIVIELIKEYRLENRVILSSFNHDSLVFATRLAPEIETAPILAERLYMPWIYAQSILAKGFHPNYLAVDEEMIKRSLENNVAIRPYTVNKEADMERLVKGQCSAIITNYPNKAVRIRSKVKKP